MSVAVPLQQVPAGVAVFLAEASLALLHPACAMYGTINKLLLREQKLSIEVWQPTYPSQTAGNYNALRENCEFATLIQVQLSFLFECSIQFAVHAAPFSQALASSSLPCNLVHYTTSVWQLPSDSAAMKSYLYFAASAVGQHMH